MSELPAVSFKERVYELMSQLPEGKVTTYGDLAALAGHPYAARQVGGIAHFGPTELPWHRLVNRLGYCASGYCGGGKAGQQRMLEAEGFQVENYRIVDFEERRWRPNL